MGFTGVVCFNWIPIWISGQNNEASETPNTSKLPLAVALQSLNTLLKTCHICFFTHNLEARCLLAKIKETDILSTPHIFCAEAFKHSLTKWWNYHQDTRFISKDWTCTVCNIPDWTDFGKEHCAPISADKIWCFWMVYKIPHLVLISTHNMKNNNKKKKNFKLQDELRCASVRHSSMTTDRWGA